jgi:hypothetical protein
MAPSDEDVTPEDRGDETLSLLGRLRGDRRSLDTALVAPPLSIFLPGEGASAKGGAAGSGGAGGAGGAGGGTGAEKRDARVICCRCQRCTLAIVDRRVRPSGETKTLALPLASTIQPGGS